MAHSETKCEIACCCDDGADLSESETSALEVLRAICSGKVTLVTGAGRGLGREVFEVFTASGMSVYTFERDTPDASDIEQRMQCDVRHDSIVREQVERIVDTHGRLDIVVNCAGIYDGTGILDSNFNDALTATLATNLHGAINVTRACLPRMMARNRGLILNVCSSWADTAKPSRGGLTYKLSKAALQSFTVTLAEELSATNVRVVAYSPPRLATRITNYIGEKPLVGAVDVLDIAVRHLIEMERSNG